MRLEGSSPDGGGLNEQKVKTNGQALVFAIVQDELEFVSQKTGEAFNWSSGVIDIDAADTVLLLKNTSSRNLHIERIIINNGGLASQYQVHLPASEVTVTGTTVTGTNINTAKSNVAEAQAASDETTNTQGLILHTPLMAVNANLTINTRGLTLGKNKSVAIDVVADTTESAVTIRGFYNGAA